MLIVLTGPSCSGKSTCAKLINQDYKLVTATTRQPREGEVDGVDYHFCTMKDFEDMIEQNELFEWNFFGGNYYGIIQDNLDWVLSITSHNYFVILDSNGARKLKNAYPDSVKTVFFYTSEPIVKQRLIKRGDYSESRIKEVKKDIEFVKDADFVINNDIDNAYGIYRLYISFFETLIDIYDIYKTKTKIEGEII